MLHYGQGKWYPGEPLPRWQYGLFWRKDGYPIWKNTKLTAHETIEKKYTQADAARFATELARHLAISTDNVRAAYEDVFYFLWTEGQLPANIDPMKTNLRDPAERRTLAQLLDAGLDKPAGYILPLKWNYYSNEWQSCQWVLKREQLFLLPGNSPVGFRLPLESLPAVAKDEQPEQVERSLFDELPELEHYHDTISSRYGQVSAPPVLKQRISFQEEKPTDKKKKTEKEDNNKPRSAWKRGKAFFIFFFHR
jgi:uncharacterized protein (DUF2126 family)